MNEPNMNGARVVVAKTDLTEVVLEDGILIYDYLAPGIDETIEEAMKVLDEAKRNLQGRKYPVLVHMEKLNSVSAEARAYHAGAESAKVYTAVALIVKSPVARIIGNFYVTIGRPIFPVKMCSTEQEAIAWLRTFSEIS